MTYTVGAFVSGGDLSGWVQRELRAIADELNNAQGAASLYTRADSAPLTVPVTFVPLDLFTDATPLRDWRAVWGEVPGALYVRRAGIVGCSFTVTGLVPGADQYVVALFVNGIETDLKATFDPSNQTAGGTFTALGTFRVVGASDRVADKFELRIRNLGGAQTFTMQRGYFSVWWIGD